MAVLVPLPELLLPDVVLDVLPFDLPLDPFWDVLFMVVEEAWRLHGLLGRWRWLPVGDEMRWYGYGGMGIGGARMAFFLGARDVEAFSSCCVR